MSEGLAANPAAPADLLLTLLQRRPDEACAGLRHRSTLPPPLQEAMAQHPSRLVRVTLAEHRDVAPALRARLLLADADWKVRVRAFGRPGQRPLPDEALVEVMAEICRSASDLMATEVELFTDLFFAEPAGWTHLARVAAAHPDAKVRQYIASSARGQDELDVLLADPVPQVRAAAAEAIAERGRLMQPADLPAHHCHGFWAVLHRPLSRALVDHVLTLDDPAALRTVAGNPSTPPDVVEMLLSHGDSGVRHAAVSRAALPVEQVLRLAADPATEVRRAVSAHPGLTEQQRARIDIGAGDASPGRLDRRCPGDLGLRCPGDLDEALRWATSVDWQLRRRAARHPDLPPPLVAALAEDPDPGVRVLLAHHHPQAPQDLLLRCYLEGHRGWDRLRGLPRFPTEGLARFAEDPDPQVRRLVALDPSADPLVVHHLLTDPDPAVRHAMAGCPRLPPEQIVALLDHPELARRAAANPALPDLWLRLPPPQP